MLNHVVNIHDWPAIFPGEYRCAHGEIQEEDRDAPWLEPDSPPHNTLREIVLDTRLLNTLKYYINFR